MEIIILKSFGDYKNLPGESPLRYLKQILEKPLKIKNIEDLYVFPETSFANI